MKKYIILIAVAVCALVGCTDPVEDYYVGQNSTNARTETILSYLSSESDYSLFVELLNESGLIDTIVDGYSYTIFAPSNTALETAGVADMTTDSMLFYLQMHICANPKTTSTLSYTSRLLMFSDKYLAITQDESSYMVDGVRLSEADILCTDGVIHKIEEILTPRLTIYEWLQQAGDEFSVFREALDESTVYIFDRENSVQIGETALGRPIYDSVFYVFNTILMYGDISDEESQYRFVIPTNDVITETFTEMADSYTTKGMSVTEADSTEWMNWYLETSTFDYSETGIESFDDLDTIAEFSVFGNEFRPTAITMADPIRLSNGFAYVIEKGHLPAYIPMVEAEVYPAHIRWGFIQLGLANGTLSNNWNNAAKQYTDGRDYDGWSAIFTGTWNAGMAVYDVYSETTGYPRLQIWFANMYDAEGNIDYYCKTVSVPGGLGTYDFEEIEIVPGNYTLDISCPTAWSISSGTIDVPSGNDDYLIYINDVLIDEIGSIPEGDYIELTRIGNPEGFYIGDSIGMAKLTLRIREDHIHPDYTSYSSTFAIYKYVLTPYNNY